VNAIHRLHRSTPRWLRAHEPGLLVGLLAAAIILRICLVAFSPAPFGYVWDFYYEGVRFLYARGRLPLASDCWQCYHPPLFFLLGWPFYAIGHWIGRGLGEDAALRWLAALPLACGAITTYYGYRLLRLFRSRGAVLVLGVGLLLTFPCLFISSNGAEADILVTAILSALIFYLTRDAALGPPTTLAATARLGVLAGLAAATKYSGLVGVATILSVFGVHVVAGRRRAVALGDMALVAAICAGIGGWKYVDNFKWYGTAFQANGSAAQSFSLQTRDRFSSNYEFSTFHLHDLLETVGQDAQAGELTRLPVYRSVFTTLHGLGWSDMNFFSEPTRHGDPTRPYPSKRQFWGITASVLVLGLVPEGLALLGVAVTWRRRSFTPAIIFTVLGLTSYAWWFLAQTAWGLKTKYILFLLPPGVLFAVAGLAWTWRHTPAIAGITLAGLLAALILLAHAYLLFFSIG
jgi:hypothetical protein